MRFRRLWTTILLSMAFLCLIFDSKTAINGAAEGIDLCVKVIIPSLFPFFVISTLLNNNLSGQTFNILNPIERLCNIPKGTSSILLIGLTGGYPVGAQCINNAYQDGVIQKQDARRMLAFCNNAGPAFIFGVVAHLFQEKYIVLIIWALHIIAAITVAIISPVIPQATYRQQKRVNLSLTTAIEISVKNISLVCAWVILFRVLIVYLQRWLLWCLSPQMQSILLGFTELSNGILMLNNLPKTGDRFILALLFINMGGFCVFAQTISAAKDVGLGMYFPGKIIQTSVGYVLSGIAQRLLFVPSEQSTFPTKSYIFAIAIGIIFTCYLNRHKKTVAFPPKTLYNRENRIYMEVNRVI